MIVVAVLMISCQVSMLPNRKNDGAHTMMSSTQNAKKIALLAISAAPPANRSKNPTRLDTSEGISTARPSPIGNTSTPRIPGHTHRIIRTNCPRPVENLHSPGQRRYRNGHG